MLKLLLLLLFLFPLIINASPFIIINNNGYNPTIFLWLVIFIFLTRGLSIVKKIGFPIIIGEILAGVIIGQTHILGSHPESNSIISFLTDFGAVILMFEIGLESKLSDLIKNFKIGIKLAAIGTFLSFGAGFLISISLISDYNIYQALLLGTITAATATGISAKTFKELGLIRTKEVKVVLMASILDEVMSVFCFGIISPIIIQKKLNLLTFTFTIFEIILFFIFAAIFAMKVTPILTKWSTKINSGINMKVGVLLMVCFLFSYIAYFLGLATVIGAFVAGLILDQVYFNSFSKSHFLKDLETIKSKIENVELKNNLHKIIKQEHDKNLQELLKPISHLFVPLFFISIGLQIDLSDLLNLRTLCFCIIILSLSLIARIISGFLVGESTSLNKMIIGLGMTPVGEAGLIFAMFGKVNNLINNSIFTAIVACVIIASVLTPILIRFSMNRHGVNHES